MASEINFPSITKRQPRRPRQSSAFSRRNSIMGNFQDMSYFITPVASRKIHIDAFCP